MVNNIREEKVNLQVPAFLSNTLPQTIYMKHKHPHPINLGPAGFQCRYKRGLGRRLNR